MQTHHGDFPGPVDGEYTDGGMFTEEQIEIEDLADLEKYCNDRICGYDGVPIRERMWWPEIPRTPVQFQTKRLVFTHCDVRWSNILFCEDDGSLVLLDWKSAGFYPRTFERATLDRNWSKFENDDPETGCLAWQRESIDAVKALLPLTEEKGIEEWKLIYAQNNGWNV